ncbi:hypothetical protein WJX79_004783 [Trebouxia sp. C0005]
MLTRWTCHDDCRYRCMDLRKLYTIDQQDGSKCKYFGKWPFQRVFGIQELLSVIFSLANLAAHAHNIYKLRTAHLTNQHQPSFGSSQGPVWGLWYTYALGSINAWWWSAVFHSRDTYVTERLDYLSADTSAGAVNPLVVTVSQTLAGYTVATFSASVRQDFVNTLSTELAKMYGSVLVQVASISSGSVVVGTSVSFLDSVSGGSDAAAYEQLLSSSSAHNIYGTYAAAVDVSTIKSSRTSTPSTPSTGTWQFHIIFE